MAACERIGIRSFPLARRDAVLAEKDFKITALTHDQRAWPLAELTEAGYMGACHYIGFTVLRMLEYAHPQVLAPFPTLTPPPGPAIPVPDLITLLHRQSLDDRSSRYVATIDALMERHKDEVADTSWPEQWPTFRAHLLRTYSD